MAGVYDSNIETTKELTAEFGQLCYWKKAAPISEVDPGYPGVGTLPDPVPCYIVFLSQRDLNRGVQQYLDMIPGTEVPDNTEIGLLAGGQTFTPENTDMILRGDISADPIAIMKIDALAPNGTPILYYITVGA